MNGALIGEQADELAAVHARPMAHAAGIEMHEGRVGARVIADTAALHAQADRADALRRHVRQIEIDGLAERMLALLRHIAGAPAQGLVGLRRAIGGDDMYGLARAGGAVHFPEQIIQTRIHLRRLVAAPVTHHPVELAQAAAVIAPVTAEGDADALAGMHLDDLEGAGIAVGHRILRATGEGDQNHERQGQGHDATRADPAEQRFDPPRSHDPYSPPATGAAPVHARAHPILPCATFERKH